MTKQYTLILDKVDATKLTIEGKNITTSYI